MSRIFVLAVMSVVSLASVGLAQVSPSSAKGKPAPEIIPASAYGESKPSSCPGCNGAQTPPFVPSKPHLQGRGTGLYGDYLRYQLTWDQHQCAPDGCPKPIGCGNLWTEIKFIFGSCRQFYGTGESTINHHRNTRYRD